MFGEPDASPAAHYYQTNGKKIDALASVYFYESE
jgi:hypothetical protein